MADDISCSHDPFPPFESFPTLQLEPFPPKPHLLLLSSKPWQTPPLPPRFPVWGSEPLCLLSMKPTLLQLCLQPRLITFAHFSYLHAHTCTVIIFSHLHLNAYYLTFTSARAVALPGVPPG